MNGAILASRLGTRLSEKATIRPQPMIRNRRTPNPLLWHIMKTHSPHGLHEFIALQLNPADRQSARETTLVAVCSRRLQGALRLNSSPKRIKGSRSNDDIGNVRNGFVHPSGTCWGCLSQEDAQCRKILGGT